MVMEKTVAILNTQQLGAPAQDAHLQAQAQHTPTHALTHKQKGDDLKRRVAGLGGLRDGNNGGRTMIATVLPL